VIISALQSIWELKQCLPKVLILTVSLFCLVIILLSFHLTHIKNGYISITKDQKSVLDYLNKNYFQNELLISQDQLIGYLSSIYTPYRALYSHMHNTPDNIAVNKRQDDFIEYGVQDSVLQTVSKVVVVLKDNGSNTWKNNSKLLFKNSSFEVWRLLPEQKHVDNSKTIYNVKHK
jgi:hypothetical protein